MFVDLASIKPPLPEVVIVFCAVSMVKIFRPLASKTLFLEGSLKAQVNYLNYFPILMSQIPIN